MWSRKENIRCDVCNEAFSAEAKVKENYREIGEGFVKATDNLRGLDFADRAGYDHAVEQFSRSFALELRPLDSFSGCIT